MDHMRRDEIGAEIEGYQHKIRIGFSSVTVGDVVQLISEVERLQKERDQLGAGGKVWQRTAGHLKQERDAALAEVERLKGRLSECEDEAEAMRTTITSGDW